MDCFNHKVVTGFHKKNGFPATLDKNQTQKQIIIKPKYSKLTSTVGSLSCHKTVKLAICEL